MEQEKYEQSVLWINKQIELLHVKKEILDLVRDMPHSISAYTRFEEVDIDLPYNLPMLNEASKWLNERGWNAIDRHFSEVTGCLYVTFSHKDFILPVKISLNTGHEGSLCKLEKVGETTFSIYATTCLES